MRRYYRLFPFGKIPFGSKIAIFGAGLVGEDYQLQLRVTGHCTNIAFLDNAAVGQDSGSRAAIDGVAIHPPDFLRGNIPDYIIIAAWEAGARKEMRNQLLGMEVPESKIIEDGHEIPMAARFPDVTPNPENSTAWDRYYERAEKDAEGQFKEYIEPILDKYQEILFTRVLDFACGRGRMAAQFMKFSTAVVCCDVNRNAVEYCRGRFGKINGACHLSYCCNAADKFNVVPLPFEDGEFSFIYSWDSMVHFDYKWLDRYLEEFFRVLQSGGYTLIHHSNYGNVPSSEAKSLNFLDNPHGRSLVTVDDVRFIAEKHGFRICEQNVINWGLPNMDCISLLVKERIHM